MNCDASAALMEVLGVLQLPDPQLMGVENFYVLYITETYKV